MGRSTNGILAYGYDLGGPEEWKVREWDDDSYTLNVPWAPREGDEGDNDADEDEDEESSWEGRLTGQIVRAWNVQHGTSYKPGDWSDGEDVLKLAGIELETYCSDSYPMYVLCAADPLTAYRGDAVDTTEKLAADRAQWDEQLSWALQALGLTPKQEKPAWLLCSYADGF